MAAIEAFSGEKVMVQGAGRTDAGVHAIGQVAHFDLAAERETDTVRDAINAHLRPHPVAVLSAEKVAGRFRRAPLGAAPPLSLSHRQPPARPRAGARPRLARAAPARRRGDACGRAAADRQARLHDVSLDRMPGQVAGEDARPARRVARRRGGPHHRRRALVPAQSGALDGRLAGAGRRRQMAAGRSCGARSQARDRAACGPVAPPEGFIWCAWTTKPVRQTHQGGARMISRRQSARVDTSADRCSLACDGPELSGCAHPRSSFRPRPAAAPTSSPARMSQQLQTMCGPDRHRREPLGRRRADRHQAGDRPRAGRRPHAADAATSAIMSLAVNTPTPFEISRDLAPMSLVSAPPYILVAHPSVPAKKRPS